jgi:hypothetical protein
MIGFAQLQLLLQALQEPANFGISWGSSWGSDLNKSYFG